MGAALGQNISMAQLQIAFSKSPKGVLNRAKLTNMFPCGKTAKTHNVLKKFMRGYLEVDEPVQGHFNFRLKRTGKYILSQLKILKFSFGSYRRNQRRARRN